MFGATDTDANLFHEIPAVIVDSFPYIEDSRGRYALIGPADAVHVRKFGIEILEREVFGWDELIKAGTDQYSIWSHVVLKACDSLGICEAIVTPQFPVFLADALREGGMKLRIDAEVFSQRRRVKTGQELEGKVTWISREAEFTPRNVQTAEERSKLVYRVKVTPSNSSGILKPGMPVEAELQASK